MPGYRASWLRFWSARIWWNVAHQANPWCRCRMKR